MFKSSIECFTEYIHRILSAAEFPQSESVDSFRNLECSTGKPFDQILQSTRHRIWTEERCKRVPQKGGWVECRSFQTNALPPSYYQVVSNVIKLVFLYESMNETISSTLQHCHLQPYYSAGIVQISVKRKRSRNGSSTTWMQVRQVSCLISWVMEDLSTYPTKIMTGLSTHDCSRSSTAVS